MQEHRRLVFLLGLGALIAFLHIAAIKFDLYFTFWWFDVLVHFLAGVLVAVFGLYFLRRFTRIHIEGRVFFLAGIILSLSVGALWEFFEYWNGIIFVGPEEYAVDTFSDLFTDFVGGSVGAYYAGVKEHLPTFLSINKRASSGKHGNVFDQGNSLRRGLEGRGAPSAERSGAQPPL